MPGLGRRLALALAAALLAAGRARAAPGPLVGWGSGGTTGLSWDATQGHATALPLVRESNLRGYVGLSLAGQLVDSRWLGWTWNVRPGFVKSGGNQPDASLATSELAHQFTATSQPWAWLRAQGSADRDRIVANRGEEATRESRFAHAEARAEIRTPAFTLGTLGRREHSDDRWMSTALAPELERHVARRSLEAWLESSKLRVFEQRTRESVPGVAGDVSTRRETVDHAFRWGRGSRLATRLEWDGQSPRALTLIDRSIEESLHLRHANWLSSDYRFQDTHAQFVAGDGSTRSHFAELSARTDGLGLALSGGVRSDRSPGREGSAWSLGPHAFWQRSGPLGLRVTGELGASLERERRTGAADSRVAVASEAHPVPVTRTFALAEEGVDSATVVVRDANGVAGFTQGLDWALVRSGAQSFITIPLGSRIAVGDVLLLAYEATPPGIPNRRSTRANGALGLEWRGVSVRYEDWQTQARDTPTDRGATGLGQREQAATASAALPRGPARLDLSASTRRRVVEGRAARTDAAQASLTWQLSPAWLASAEAGVSSAGESAGRLGSRLQGVRLAWNPGGAWRWGVHVDRAAFDRAGAPDVTQLLAGADASARWGLLDAALRLDAGDRSGEPGHRFGRVSLALTRRLR